MAISLDRADTPSDRDAVDARQAQKERDGRQHAEEPRVEDTAGRPRAPTSSVMSVIVAGDSAASARWMRSTIDGASDTRRHGALHDQAHRRLASPSFT